MRSLLFVPGNNDRKLEKAYSSGADALIIDLEDSVSLPQKPSARNYTANFLQSHASKTVRPRLIVRINDLSSGLIDRDLQSIVSARPDAVMLPKAEGSTSVTRLDNALSELEIDFGVDKGHVKIIAIANETAASLFLSGTFRDASSRLIALTWGAEDLATELGAECNRDAKGHFLDPYRLARTLCLASATHADIPAIDTVYVDFRDDARLKDECDNARRDGFTGKLAIHPAQVPIINLAFTPTPAAMTRASAIVAAFSENPDVGTIAIEGVMYDRPHFIRAQALLARRKHG